MSRHFASMFRSRNRRCVTPPRLFVVVGAVFLSLFCYLPAGASSRAEGVKSFEGKTIDIIIPNAPGTAPALLMTAMQPELEKYLGATINLTYNSDAQTVADNTVGSSAPNGLTLGIMGLPAAMVTEFTGTAVDFSLPKASWIGATHNLPDVLVACDGAPIQSMGQLVQGKTMASVLAVNPGPAGELDQLLMSAWSVPHKVLDGYTSTTIVPGCLRGDGNLEANTVVKVTDVTGTTMQPGMKPLLLTGAIPSSFPSAFLNKAAPTLAAFAKAHPPKTAAGKEAVNLAIAAFSSDVPDYTLYGPPGIPKAQVQALQDAYAAASATPAVKKTLLSIDLPVGVITPAAIQSYLKTQFAQSSEIIPYLNQ
jgi:tripartite-type tricarboxylate transporter receptor subunit TctC